MACAGCERRRRVMKEALAKGMAHAARLAGLRSGVINGEAANDPEPAPVAAAKVGKATGDQQAGDPGAAHRQQGVAKPAASRAAAGQSPVPKVRKARGGA